MDVAIVGAGISGLVTAHLMGNAGHAVTVIERDDDVSSTAGYRLHLDPAAVEVLRTALPENTFECLLASGTGGDTFSHLAVLDEHGTTVLRIPRGDGSLMIGRRPLRRILLRDLNDAIKWGVTAVSLRRSDSARTSLVDGDGADIVEADLVVIADGTGSKLAQQVIGRCTAEPAGVIGIAGRSPITAATRPLIPHGLWRGPGFVVGKAATTAFLAVHDVDSGRVPSGLDPDLEDPYLLWSLILDGIRRPSAPLLQVVLDAAAAWSPSLRELLRRSDPDSVEAFTFYRPTDLRPWQSDRVAVIGDAAHPVPPTAGIGASIAIADAGDLSTAICSAGADLRVAIRDVQPCMLRRASAAARSSRRVLTTRSLLRREWLRHLALHAVLPLLDTATSAVVQYRHKASDTQT